MIDNKNCYNHTEKFLSAYIFYKAKIKPTKTNNNDNTKQIHSCYKKLTVCVSKEKKNLLSIIAVTLKND